MRRGPTPSWLDRPSRFAGLDRGAARLVLAVCAALILIGLIATRFAGIVPEDPGGDGLYQTIVEGVRHGGRYYAVAADAMRAQGDPLRPFVAVPLPTLAVVQAALPVLATEMLFWALGAVVLITWYGRLRPWLARPTARFVAAALLAAMLLEGVRYDLLDVPESWAGLLLALSLALWRPGRWIEPAAFGLAATLVCIAAAPYLVVMGGIAIFEGRRREAIGWALALGILTIALAAHAHAVAQIVRPLDAGGPDRMTLPGFGPVLRAIMESTAPGRLPSLLATLVLGLALFGWTAWRDALAVRVVALFATGVVVLAVAGRAGGSRDGLVFAPLLPVGLLFAVDGLRDLGRIALDRRRITVKRVIR